ncbi:hypothetical protein HNY73_006510 [Argiope bruennichi]|uniref:Uncharacterized protein n=1 Tax=Argiope bruennichi TaxID=94029 RepID=A0A8T0FDL7_ARGBR|nr:hypothetical protein HNY73_006510 [Argiope bruennichi]
MNKICDLNNKSADFDEQNDFCQVVIQGKASEICMALYVMLRAPFCVRLARKETTPSYQKPHSLTTSNFKSADSES